MLHNFSFLVIRMNKRQYGSCHHSFPCSKGYQVILIDITISQHMDMYFSFVHVWFSYNNGLWTVELLMYIQVKTNKISTAKGLEPSIF